MQTRKVIIRTLSIATVSAVAASLAPSAEGAAGTTTTSSTTTSAAMTLQQAVKNVYQPAWKSAPTTALAYDCVALPLTLTNKSIVAGAPAVPTGGAVLTLSATGATLYSDAKCSVAASTFTMTAPSATVYLRAPIPAFTPANTPISVTVTAAGDGTTVLSASTTLTINRPAKARLVITKLTPSGMYRTGSYTEAPPYKCGVHVVFTATVVNVGQVASAPGSALWLGCPGWSGEAPVPYFQCGEMGAPAGLGGCLAIPAGATVTTDGPAPLGTFWNLSCDVATASAAQNTPTTLTGSEVVSWTTKVPGVEYYGSGSLKLADICAQAQSSGTIDGSCKWQ